MKINKKKLGTTSFENFAKENGISIEKVKKIDENDLNTFSLINKQITLYKYISKKSGENIMVIEESFFNEDLFYKITLAEIEEDKLSNKLIKELLGEEETDISIEKLWYEEEKEVRENDKRKKIEMEDAKRKVGILLSKGNRKDFNFVYNVYCEQFNVFIIDLLGDILFELDPEKCDKIEKDGKYFN